MGTKFTQTSLFLSECIYLLDLCSAFLSLCVRQFIVQNSCNIIYMAQTEKRDSKGRYKPLDILHNTYQKAMWDSGWQKDIQEGRIEGEAGPGGSFPWCSCEEQLMVKAILEWDLPFQNYMKPLEETFWGSGVSIVKITSNSICP